MREHHQVLVLRIPPQALTTALMKVAVVMLRCQHYIRFVTSLTSSNDSRLPRVEFRGLNFIFLIHPLHPSSSQPYYWSVDV